LRYAFGVRLERGRVGDERAHRIEHKPGLLLGGGGCHALSAGLAVRARHVDAEAADQGAFPVLSGHLDPTFADDPDVIVEFSIIFDPPEHGREDVGDLPRSG